MNKTSPSVDGFIRKHQAWQKELEALRTIALSCPLVEEIKWRQPCYTFEGNNVVLISTMKAGATLSFMKGSLLKDEHGILETPGPNTQAARMIRFTSAAEITKLKSVLKAYINEAIELEKAGKKVAFKKEPEPVPAELEAKFKTDAKFKAAFEALTPGRQRGYILHFSGAKQSATRTGRIEKCASRILAGKGMHD